MARDKKAPRLTEDGDRERIRGQVLLVVEALGGPQRVTWWSESGSGDPADMEYLCRTGHILVRDADLARLREVLPEVRVVDSLIDGVTLLVLTSGHTVQEALDVVDRELGAGVATPDHVLYVSAPTGGCCPANEPSVPASPKPVPGVSTDRTDGRGVLVSVVDTGWHSPAASHPDTPWLKGVTGDEETIDEHDIHPYAGHGTFIAGVVRCIAPRAQVRVEGFLPTGGAVFESEIVKQLYQALRLGPDIISLSAGAHTRNHQPLLGFDAFYEKALRHLKGTVLVAAAGNDGNRIPFWPAAFPWTVSVGALDADGTRAAYSNFGSWVDVYARGTDLVNAYPTGHYVCHEPPSVGEGRDFKGTASWSGTSFSAPTVAGIIAARMSHTGQSARQAADSVLALAAGVPGVGAVLTPGPQNLA